MLGGNAETGEKENLLRNEDNGVTIPPSQCWRFIKVACFWRRKLMRIVLLLAAKNQKAQTENACGRKTTTIGYYSISPVT